MAIHPSLSHWEHIPFPHSQVPRIKRGISLGNIAEVHLGSIGSLFKQFKWSKALRKDKNWSSFQGSILWVSICFNHVKFFGSWKISMLHPWTHEPIWYISYIGALNWFIGVSHLAPHLIQKTAQDKGCDVIDFASAELRDAQSGYHSSMTCPVLSDLAVADRRKADPGIILLDWAPIKEHQIHTVTIYIYIYIFATLVFIYIF